MADYPRELGRCVIDERTYRIVDERVDFTMFEGLDMDAMGGECWTGVFLVDPVRRLRIALEILRGKQ